jgi:hypothetical protein
MRPSILNPLFAGRRELPSIGPPVQASLQSPASFAFALRTASLAMETSGFLPLRRRTRLLIGIYILNSLCRQPHIIYFGSQGGGCSLNHFSTSGVLAYAGNWLNGSGLRPINIAGNCTFGNGFSLLCPQTLIPALANARTIVSAKPPGPALGNSYRRRRETFWYD